MISAQKTGYSEGKFALWFCRAGCQLNEPCEKLSIHLQMLGPLENRKMI